MMDPVDAAPMLDSLAQQLYVQIEQAKVNKGQCQRLAERLREVETALRALNRTQDSVDLWGLERVLQHALVLVQKFSVDRWFIEVLKAGTHEGDFSALREALERAAQRLNAGLAFEAMLHQEQDQAAVLADTAFLQAQQLTIIRLNQARLAAVQGLEGQEQAIAFLQAASMKNQLERLLHLRSALAPSNSSVLGAPPISYHDLVFQKKIAQSASATIYQGLWEGRRVAIKIRSGFLSEAEQAIFHQAVATTSSLAHPHITTIDGACLGEGYACLVMEYMAEGTLSDFLKKGPYSLEQRLVLALGIAKALNHLHQKGIVLQGHLKSTHVLVNAEGQAKLRTFGSSHSSASSVHAPDEHSQALAWQLSECFANQPATSAASDIYRFGLILWEIMTGQTELTPTAVPRPDASLGAFEAMSSEVPASVVALIRACCALNASERPTAEAIISFIRDGQNFRTFLPGYCAIQNLKDQGSIRSPTMAHQSAHSSFSRSTFNTDYALGLRLWSKGRYSQALIFFLKISQNPQDADYLPACLRLLHLYAQGIGLSLGRVKAEGYERIIAENLAWFIKKASEGKACAHYNLGLLYHYGYGVTQDYGQARAWYERAAAQGDAEAQSNLGVLYERGYGIAQDNARARFWYEQAAAQGDAEAQRSLGLLYELGHGVAQEDARARFWYEQAAAQGDAEAQYSLGLLYDAGNGIAQNYVKAHFWYERAAAQGHAEAQYNLGVLYELGQGVTQDYAKARFWYEQAAAQGNAEAQRSLGILYELGYGVERDYAKASFWYEQAAAQGDAEAQRNLGGLHELGHGVEQDDTKASFWYGQAAVQGDAEAQRSLGVLYEHGHGVEQDDTKARFWYERAAAQGDVDAQEALLKLEPIKGSLRFKKR